MSDEITGDGRSVQTRRSEANGITHDPRAGARLSERDIGVLRFLAIAREAAQYQIHALLFAGRSEVAVSRCVRRLAGLGLVTVDRWRKVGINRIRLSPRGAAYLLEHRLVPEDQIHVALRPAADKDIAHVLWTVDILVLFGLHAPGVEALPCWHLRRKLGTAAGVSIADILAISPAPEAPVIAVEIDRATERMAVVVEKLRALDQTLETLASDAEAMIVFLTIGERRVQAIRKAIATLSFRASMAIATLPSEPGRPGLRYLAETVFNRTV